MQSELKPCPFCGSDRVTVWNIRDGQQAVCKECKSTAAPTFHGPDGRDATWGHAIEAWNRRAALSEQQAVEVKALEWHGDGDCYAFAEVTHTSYSIAFEEGRYWANWNVALPPFDTLDDAKAAAQADYEQRIRSALVDVPAVEPVAGYRRRLPQYAFEHYEFEQPGYENPSISDWEPLYTSPPLSREGDDSAEAFARIVAARRAYVEATETYNARLSLVNSERAKGNWSMRVDDEARAMWDAQSAFIKAAQDETDAALAATRSGSATTASGTSAIRQRGESEC